MTPFRIAVAQYDVVVDRLDDLLAVGFKIGRRVVPERRVDGCDLLFHLFEAIRFGSLAQFLECPPRIRLIGNLLVLMNSANSA